MARHAAYGKTRGQIRERLLAAHVDGTSSPICGSHVFRHQPLDLRHTDAAVR